MKGDKKDNIPRTKAPLLLRKAVCFITAIIATWLFYRLTLLIQSGWAFTTDDAFITLRYARNWVDGHGIYWNPGDQPVEGYSNFLYLLLAATSMKLGFDPVFTVKIIGVI